MHTREPGLTALHAAVAAVCPIEGLSVVNADTHEIRIDADTATVEERAAAHAVIKGFDWSEEAQAIREVESLHATILDDPKFQALAGAIADTVLKQVEAAVPGFKRPSVEAIVSDMKTSAVAIGADASKAGSNPERIASFDSRMFQ